MGGGDIPNQVLKGLLDKIPVSTHGKKKLTVIDMWAYDGVLPLIAINPSTLAENFSIKVASVTTQADVDQYCRSAIHDHLWREATRGKISIPKFPDFSTAWSPALKKLAPAFLIGFGFLQLRGLAKLAP